MTGYSYFISPLVRVYGKKPSARRSSQISELNISAFNAHDGHIDI